jgi:required for meiotic nuclear division protein 1
MIRNFLRSFAAQAYKKKPTLRRTGRESETIKEPQPAEAMRCFASCTAHAYNLTLVKHSLCHENISAAANFEDDCVQLTINDKGRISDAFFMKDGCVITWNTTKEQERFILDKIKPAEINPYEPELLDFEELEYTVDERKNSGITDENIVIGYADKSRENIYAKLAFSHGLARATQLGVLENHLSQFLNSIEDLPAYMISGQEPPLNAKQVMIKTGQLLKIRGLLNLHSELVDSSPEFYWTRADLGKLYEQVSRILELQPRIRVLNQRLDHANRMVGWMENHLSKKHGTRMEGIIIALIAVEVGFELLHYLS